MKIKEIYVKDFLGISLFDAEIDKPVCLVAGANASGKSSIQNAVRMIVTGSPSRVSLKGKYGELVKKGSSSATVSLLRYGVDGVDSSNLSIKKSGSTEGAATPENIQDTVHACLDPHFFTDLDEKERKSFIIKMYGVDMDFDDIKAKLIKQGIDEEYINDLQMPLRLGFKDAAKEAKARMSVARINWKKTTGETHGVNKADGWALDIPKFDSELLKEVQADIATVQKLVFDKKAQISSKKYFLDSIKRNEEVLLALQKQFEMPVPTQSELDKMKKEVSDLRHVVNGEEKALSQPEKAKAGPKPKNRDSFLVCPECSTKLVVSRSALTIYEPVVAVKETVKDKAELERRRADLNVSKQELHNLASEYGQAVLNVRLVEEARIKIEATKQATELPEEIKESEEEMVDFLGHLEDELKTLYEREAKEVAVGQEADRVFKVNLSSAVIHEEFMAWSALFDQMSPTGLPSEILGPCVKDLNKKLRDHSKHCKWGPVEITQDCGIVYDNINYYLLSESEQWRTDVMIAAAIADVSEYNFIMVDRVDVLSPHNRPVFLKWCKHLADEKGFQCLMFATLKQAPSIDWMKSVWLENGGN